MVFCKLRHHSGLRGSSSTAAAYLATRACSSNDFHDNGKLDWLILHSTMVSQPSKDTLQPRILHPTLHTSFDCR